MTNWGRYKYGNDDVESVGGDGEERRNDELGALQVRESRKDKHLESEVFSANVIPAKAGIQLSLRPCCP